MKTVLKAVAALALLLKEDVAAIVAYLRSVAPVDRDPGATRLGPVGWVLFATSMRTTLSGIDGHAIRPPMPVALYAKMTDTEVGALWAYLSTLR